MGHFSHQNELNMNQKTPCLQMLNWKLHVRMSMSPRKSPFIVFITPSILNKNGGDRYIHTYIMIYLVTLASSALAGFHEGRVLQNT
jgi:hypothetical protein